MRRRAPLSLLLAAVLGVVVAAPAAAQEDAPLQGAWVVETVHPPDEEAVTDPQPGLVLFTGTHYSMMAATSESTRANLPEEAGDAAKADAFDSFVANSGRYEVRGDTIITRAFVAKVPNYMNAWPENTTNIMYRIEGDRLHFTFQDGFSVTLRRVEGAPPPY